MGMRRWWQQRFGSAAGAEATRINLLTEAAVQLEPPSRAGIDLSGAVRPWSVQRLAALVNEATVHPSATTLQAARQARHCLSCFWLAAPTDELDNFYAGAVGDLQRQLLASPLVQQDLAVDELAWRDRLKAQLRDDANGPRQHNLLLALIPYTAPQSMTLERPFQILQDWLLPDYVAYCQPELADQLRQPKALLEPADEGDLEREIEDLEEGDAGDRPDLEPFSATRGEEAMAWFNDPDTVQRMRSLINSYSLNPEDADTLQELSGLRAVVAQLWLDVDADQLQSLFETPVGLVTRSLITSGFGQELLDDDDRRAREELVDAGSDIADPECHGALLAAFLFFPAGAVTVESTALLPGWLANELESLQPVGG